MEQPLVYIILLNYNGYKDTIECIKSLEKINYKNYRIIIVDNDSNDDSENLLRKKFPAICIIQAGKNLGFAAGNNIGIKYAMEQGAEYVLLINNDTVVEKCFLSHLVDKFSIGKDIGMVGGKIYYYDSPKEIWYNGGKFDKLRAKGRHYIREDESEYKEVEFITGCLQLISIDALKKIGLMEEKYFLYYEDVDYCFRFIKNGYKLICSGNSIIYHKCGGSASYKSPLSIYYSNRNRYLFINENYNGLIRLMSKLIFAIELVTKFFMYRGEKNKSIVRVFEYILKK